MSSETQVRVLQLIIQEVIKEKAKHIHKDPEPQEQEGKPVYAPITSDMQPSKFPRTRGSLGRAILHRAHLQQEPQPQGSLEKLTPLVNDPSVQAIESPGSDQPLIIHRSGRKQKTRISLSEEEMNKLIDTFSAKTGIPLTQGVFKATLGKLTLTAIRSNFVGTRLVLSKT